MNRYFGAEKLVENSTVQMLQVIADQAPADFLLLLARKKDPRFILDEPTIERFKRLGLFDDTGKIHPVVSESLNSVHFDFKWKDPN